MNKKDAEKICEEIDLLSVRLAESGKKSFMDIYSKTPPISEKDGLEHLALGILTIEAFRKHTEDLGSGGGLNRIQATLKKFAVLTMVEDMLGKKGG